MTALAIIAAAGLIGLGVELTFAYALARGIRSGNPSNERAEIVIQRRSHILVVRGSILDRRA